ncbi:MAG: hypothetical protein ACPGU1_10035 [Myxococcota bacterium]
MRPLVRIASALCLLMPLGCSPAEVDPRIPDAARTAVQSPPSMDAVRDEGASDTAPDTQAVVNDDASPPVGPADTSSIADTSDTFSDAPPGDHDIAPVPEDTSTTDVVPAPFQTSYTFGDFTVDVEVTPIGALVRRYTMTSTSSVTGDAQSVTVEEVEGMTLLRSGDVLVDALFALAVDEAHQNAVEAVSDGSFSSPQPCPCFTTGEQWSWVWTRDIAYSVDLGLAWLAPERSKASLAFKLSDTKQGDGQQIVQDTGSGGSWPVSSDRVVWARGAQALAPFLDPADPFHAQALDAMTQTAQQDRPYLFDPADGLYRGETSFLDWREQSYATWTASDTVHIAMSKSLSTNLAHLALLTAIDHPEAAALRAAIEVAFWDGERYLSYLGTTLDGSAPERWDLLGNALAVLDLGTHPEAIATYPFAQGGPPVIWPQQPFTPIYHNRASWPFVTAYAALAARAGGNAQAFNASLSALITGAAKHLSHMENLEFLTGDSYVEDGVFSGPVINSRRQLWSVAGFLGAIVRGVFGMEASSEGVRFTPFVTDESWDGATLHNFPLRGELIDVTLSLQGAPPPGWVTQGAVTVSADLATGGSLTEVDPSAWENLYAPQEPALSLEGTTLTFSGEAGTTFEVWGDGLLLAQDASSPYVGEPGVCYTVRAVLTASGHASQPTPPQCTWVPGSVVTLEAEAFAVEGGTWSTQYGRPHYEGWGAPGDTLKVTLIPTEGGAHLLQAVYGNGSGSVSSGITCATKWVTVREPSGAVVGEGPLVMPQRGSWATWSDSSFVSVTLEAGVRYEVTLSDGFNMSYLAHYAPYASTGGGQAPSNFVNITQMKLLRR